MMVIFGSCNGAALQYGVAEESSAEFVVCRLVRLICSVVTGCGCFLRSWIRLDPGLLCMVLIR